MSFHNTAPCFLTFYHSDQSLLPFQIQNFVLNNYKCLWYSKKISKIVGHLPSHVHIGELAYSIL